MDPAAAAEWIGRHVRVTGPVEVVHRRPWSTVVRVPMADGALAWFKACGEVQAFEPGLTSELFHRWPDLAPEVLAHDAERSWLLLAHAGTPVRDVGNAPAHWLSVLPRYAELQRGQVAHVPQHLYNGVPDLRVSVLPSRYEELLQGDLPITAEDHNRMNDFRSRFDHLCGELASCGVPETIQHDDLHMSNLYIGDGALRILDWGDSSISHPFASLLATFRFLEERIALAHGDPWISRLRDAYLEPWGQGLMDAFSLSMKVGAFAHVIAALPQRAALSGPARDHFDQDLAVRLRRALTMIA